MFKSSQNNRLQDKLDELRIRYQRISENIRSLANDLDNESRSREKLRIGRELEAEESERDSIEQKIRSLECRIAQNSVFEELMRLDYVDHIRVFDDCIAKHGMGAFVLHGKGKCGVRFLLKRILRYVCDINAASYSCIPVNVTAAQKFSVWGNLGSAGSAGFGIRDILQGVCGQLGCEPVPQSVAERLSRKRERENVVLLLEGLNHSIDLACIVREFWSVLTRMFQEMPVRSENALILLLITEDEKCLTDCDTQFAETFHHSWTPDIPVRLPAVNHFKKSDLETWMNSLFDFNPRYQKNCGADFLHDLMEKTEDGFTDMVIRHICHGLTNHKMDDGTLEGALTEWLKY